MSKFRKKPVVIEAEQYAPTEAVESEQEMRATELTGRMFMEYPEMVDEKGPFIRIHTLEGNHRADPGDWIITGVKGERYPCKPDIFEATYDAVT